MENSILIVGAGPAGLLLSLELLRRRVPVRIIEKRAGPSHTTRAITIHARTMEMFDHMGLASRIEEVGLPCPGNLYRFPGMSEADCPRTDYRVLQSRFPFYYKVNQNDFEQVLRGHLFAMYGMQPEFKTELTDLQFVEDNGGAVKVIISSSGKEPSLLVYPYVVGCDGVRSAVRTAAKIPFPGRVIAAMAMMDVPLTNVTFDDRWMNYYFDRDSFMLITKMPGEVWRLYMSEPTGKYVYREDKKEAFQEIADKIGIGLTIGEPEWASSWECHNNIAERYRNGRVLICGDASHVHSPSGGQGMNGCMQDAFNLGWKLAAVFHGNANHAILDTYEKERKPIGEQITEGSLATHEITMGFGIDPAKRFALTQVPGWEETTVQRVSGLSHNYKKVVIVPLSLQSLEGPQPGERPPDVLLIPEPKRRLYDVLRRPQFTLLIVPGHGLEAEHVRLAAELRDTINQRYPAQICSYLLSNHPYNDKTAAFDFDHRSKDLTGEFKKKYEIAEDDDRGRLVLVRPDLYIGITCIIKQSPLTLEYLDQWFMKTEIMNGNH